MIGKCWRKIIRKLLLTFCILKKKKIFRLIYQKLIRIVKKNSINDSKQRKRRMTLSCSKKLLREITSKHQGDFYCLNCLHFFRTENKLKSHEKVCKTKDFCGIVMPSEKDNILEFNQYMKSDKMPYIIYGDIESLIKKIDGCANNPGNFSTAKIGEHIPCGYSMSAIWGFD